MMYIQNTGSHHIKLQYIIRIRVFLVKTITFITLKKKSKDEVVTNPQLKRAHCARERGNNRKNAGTVNFILFLWSGAV